MQKDNKDIVMKVMLGTKLGMTQIIDESGIVTPITLVQANTLEVVKIKTSDTHGYNAIQVAFGTKKKIPNSIKGQLKDCSNKSPAKIKEFRHTTSEAVENIQAGTLIDLSSFSIGDVVKVTGKSKGKGFAGNVKRNNFSTSKRTHGGNGNVRKPGSIGSMYPQKVFKGKRMAGRMGSDKVTVKNLKVAFIDTDKGLLGIKGALPGPRKGLLVIRGIA